MRQSRCRWENVFSWVSPDLSLVGLFQLSFEGTAVCLSFAQIYLKSLGLLCRSDLDWFKEYLKNRYNSSSIVDPRLVFGSPVLGPEKNQDWTGPRLIGTANSQDRKRPKTAVRSSVPHNLEIRGPVKDRLRPVWTGLFTTKASHIFIKFHLILSNNCLHSKFSPHQHQQHQQQIVQLSSQPPSPPHSLLPTLVSSHETRHVNTLHIVPLPPSIFSTRNNNDGMAGRADGNHGTNRGRKRCARLFFSCFSFLMRNGSHGSPWGRREEGIAPHFFSGARRGDPLLTLFSRQRCEEGIAPPRRFFHARIWSTGLARTRLQWVAAQFASTGGVFCHPPSFPRLKRETEVLSTLPTPPSCWNTS